LHEDVIDAGGTVTELRHEGCRRRRVRLGVDGAVGVDEGSEEWSQLRRCRGGVEVTCNHDGPGSTGALDEPGQMLDLAPTYCIALHGVAQVCDEDVNEQSAEDDAEVRRIAVVVERLDSDPVSGEDRVLRDYRVAVAARALHAVD